MDELHKKGLRILKLQDSQALCHSHHKVNFTVWHLLKSLLEGNTLQTLCKHNKQSKIQI